MKETCFTRLTGTHVSATRTVSFPISKKRLYESCVTRVQMGPVAGPVAVIIVVSPLVKEKEISARLPPGTRVGVNCC